MKKHLNVDIVTNELRGNSAFFPQYKKEREADPQPDRPPTPASQSRQSLPRPVPPVRVVPLVPPVRGATAPKRVMKQRHPFDIYRDQYEALQEIALEERKQGGVGSMSAMVREALDQLIATKRKKK